MTRLLRLFCLFTLTFFAGFTPRAFAAIYIVVDQFSPENKFPIAVSDLVNQDSGLSDADGKAVSDILRRNLNIAGYFDIIPDSKHLDRSATLTPESIDFQKWLDTGARVFVKGAYRKKGKDLILELRLYDPQLKQMLVGKEYKVKKDQSYAAVHRFADEIMLALTGERGIFSTKIVAACGPQGKEQITLMNVDGTEKTVLAENKTINLSPGWSPRGTEIVYTSYLKYFPELYLLRAKGSGKWNKPARLTFNNTMNVTPEFSPDGQTIAFSSSMDGEPDLHLIDLNGNKVAQLTKATGIDISPTWSPDGNLLAFASERAGNLHLFVTDKNGAEPKRLTFTGYQNDTPDWSPRGDKIAFVRRSGGGFNIFTMNADGSQTTQLTSAGNNENPSFSPDGRYMVFKSSRQGGSNLYIMMFDGSNQVAITNDGQCKTPSWSPWLEAAAKKD